uniref:Uncharacterized protein n=1 Tax=Rhizophora mucronata TaxID=61149 RepID=A0A2P2PT01_RHIMU
MKESVMVMCFKPIKSRFLKSLHPALYILHLL